MSIGEVLANARCRLGLSVSEVGRRTRIRETVIWGIEQDDYSVCGGDFYVRGHIRAISGAVGMDPGPLIQEYDAAHPAAEDAAGIVALHPVRPAQLRRRSRMAVITALGVAVLAILGWSAFHVISTAGHPADRTALAAAASSAAAHRPAAHGTPRPAPSRPSPAPKLSTPAPAVPPTQALRPVRAVAFGPDGAAGGDNTRHAALAIDGSHRTAWRSDWYTTADFGNLQRGTGLLLDMGRRVTITAAQVTLGGLPGAALQLRAGNVAALPDLHEVASAARAAGTVRLGLSAGVRARYVLIWFTSLPPDDSGTYQASVYRVALQGHS